MVLSPQLAEQSYHPGTDSYLADGCCANRLVLWSIRIVEVEMKVRNLIRRRHSVTMRAGDHPEEKGKKISMILSDRMLPEYHLVVMCAEHQRLGLPVGQRLTA